MFSSWNTGSESEFAKRHRPFDPIPDKITGFRACSHCRAKKVRCKGQRGGCHRRQSVGKASPEDTKARQRRHSKDGLSALDLSTSSPISPQRQPAANPGMAILSYPSLHSSPSAHTDTDTNEGLQPETREQSHTAFDSQDDLKLPLHWTNHHGAIGTDVNYFLFDDAFFPDQVSTSLLEANVKASAANTVEEPQLPSCSSYTSPIEYLESKTRPSQPLGDHGASPREYMPIPSLTTASHCECLQTSIVAMYELDELREPGDAVADMTRALAAHKVALRLGASMVKCTICRAKMENMAILCLLVDKLADLSQAIANKVLNSDGPATAPSAPNIVFGPYSIDTADEYVALVVTLLTLHMRQLDDLMQQLQSVTACSQFDTIDRRLRACKSSVRRTYETLRKRSTSVFTPTQHV